MLLDRDEIVEGIHILQFAGVDDGHEDIPDPGSVFGFIEERILAVQDRLFQGSFGGGNLAYASGNPVQRIDPWGLEEWYLEMASAFTGATDFLSAGMTEYARDAWWTEDHPWSFSDNGFGNPVNPDSLSYQIGYWSTAAYGAYGLAKGAYNLAKHWRTVWKEYKAAKSICEGAKGGEVAGGVTGVADDVVSASTPIGRRGDHLIIPPKTNAPTNIGGRQFSGHALDQMQSRGIMPTVVENAIINGTKTVGNKPGTFQYLYEGVQAITNEAGGVITVIPK